MKHINFRQPKYLLPAILYLPLLGTGYAFGGLFTSEIKDKEDPNLKTTEYLNADLPDAVISDDIGSKRKNVRDVFGNITDHSGVENIENDLDSVRKKEDYESRYSEAELKQIEAQKAQQDEIQRLKEQNKKLQEDAKKRTSSSSSSSSSSSRSVMSDKDFPLSASDRERLNQLRRSGRMSELESGLTDGKGFGGSRSGGVGTEEGAASAGTDVVLPVPQPEEEPEKTVFKKVTASSSHFNTLASNEQESTLIKAIVDEEIKVVEGSRLRLRILDDIIIDGVTVKKGSYLYAQMSGFSQQRIKGKVSSLMVGDEIHKINLSIYDTDGLEGLYVPESSFRTAAKDVASAATSANMNVNNGNTGNNSFTQWAQQGLQSSVQQVSGAISKAIRKNKVRVKYGTHVYLVNGTTQKKRNNAK